MKHAGSHKRDLRTGLPLWLAKKPAPLKIDQSVVGIHADVVVVGTGISGALVSDALISAGYSVLALDRRKPMSGSTPASTSLLQFELDTPLIELSRKIGKSDAARAWWRSAQAVRALQERIDDLHIRVRFCTEVHNLSPWQHTRNRETQARSCGPAKTGIALNLH